MDKINLSFVKASLLYTLLGATFGFTLLFMPYISEIYFLRYAHIHLILLGGVMMLIFGIAYHILPRFTGRALYSPKISLYQFYISNAGVIGLTIFVVLRNLNGNNSIYIYLSIFFGLLAYAGIILFFYNIWKTLIPVSQAPDVLKK